MSCTNRLRADHAGCISCASNRVLWRIRAPYERALGREWGKGMAAGLCAFGGAIALGYEAFKVFG